MNVLTRRLRERCVDVYEWMDYRPDPDFRWLAALPILLALGWAYGSPIGIGIAAGLALVITLAVAALGLIAILAWIVASALADFVCSLPAPLLVASAKRSSTPLSPNGR